MQIHLSGHHLDLTDGIRDAVHNKLAKIESHYPDLDSLSAVLTVERQTQKAEMTTQYLGAQVAVNATSDDLYAAIGDAARKLDAALAKRKGAASAHRHEKPVLTEEEPAALEDEDEPLAARQ